MIRPDELVVDNFAGGGGASTGIEEALGRPIDYAINHSREAVALHTLNHPRTHHLCEDVWAVDPAELCAGRPVGLAWFSPDCTHFSRAKGGKPRSKKSRGLAWVVTRWAKAVRPRIIMLENVEEFATWGPLNADEKPCPKRAGQTFRAWVARLRSLGYAVEWRSLVAADYGAPTTRRRLFLIARCDGQPITWPAPTHGKGRTPWRSAAEIIDWTVGAPSIFDRKKPLAEATLKRIAEGVRRYVLAARPFIVPSGPHLVAPSLVQTGYGERQGQAPRALDITRPLGTVVSGGKHALVAALITKHFGGVVGHPVQQTLGTITTQDHHSLTTATLGPAGADRREAVRGFLVKYYGSSDRPESQQQSLWEPLHTVTTRARFGLVRVEGAEYQISDIGMRMLLPRELFAAQGFPNSYGLDTTVGGKRLTKTAQIALAGNSVCPPLSRALVEANTRREQRIAA